jgi:hypothetical protein
MPKQRVREFVEDLEYEPGMTCPGYGKLCAQCPWVELVPVECVDPRCRLLEHYCEMWRDCPCHNSELRTVEALAALRSRKEAREVRIDAEARRRKKAAAAAASGRGVVVGVDRGYKAFCKRRGLR